MSDNEQRFYMELGERFLKFEQQLATISHRQDEQTRAIVESRKSEAYDWSGFQDEITELREQVAKLKRRPWWALFSRGVS